MSSISRLLLFIGSCVAAVAATPEARLRPASYVSLPTQTDGNSAWFRWGGRLNVFTSIGWPLKVSTTDDPRNAWETRDVDTPEFAGRTLWMEGAWTDSDGVVFGWYHHEPGWMYSDSLLTAPKIGAVISFDGGRSVHDLGFILESGYPLDDEAKNGYFTGGHGDFSVILDREQRYFYFFFSNYSGPHEAQGVAVARLAFEDRYAPAGRVQKFYNGEWLEPGLGGRVTAVFPVARSWHHADPDAFWGPAIHWNSYLNCFVMLLNHASGLPGWSQEGIYISYATDLSRPDAWSAPVKLMDRADLPTWGGFYPEVLGLEAEGTDTLAGQVARFYVAGASRWEIEFTKAEDPQPAVDTGGAPAGGSFFDGLTNSN